jgi:hypothetical protein
MRKNSKRPSQAVQSAEAANPIAYATKYHREWF